jgi:hypothetical protein
VHNYLTGAYTLTIEAEKKGAVEIRDVVGGRQLGELIIK